MGDDVSTRLLGGSPLTVLIRLGALCLIVGALMSWFGIDPADLVVEVERGIVHVWSSGFAAFRDIGRTAAAGAAVVIPVWLVLRVLSYRSPRRPRIDPLSAQSRWGSFERVGEDRRRDP